VRPRVIIAVVAAVAIVALLTFGLISKGNSRLADGESAPSPELPKLGEPGKGSLKEYRGKWVLVNFWASWCIPCRDEAPELQKFQEEHAGANFTVVGIDTQDLSDDGSKFAREYGLTYPQLHDGNGDNGHEFGTTGVPETFVINRQGKIAALRRFQIDSKWLSQTLPTILAQKS